MKKQMSYMESVHFYGKWWGIAVALIIFALPVAVSLIFSCLPEWTALGKGLFATLPMYWAVKT